MASRRRVSVRRRHPRGRTHSPLEIRSWVIGKTPDEIHDMLTERIAAVEDAVEPYREVIARFLYPMLDESFRTLGFPAGPHTPEVTGWLARLMAWNTVARFWWDHPLRRKYLPGIATRGAPWDLLPDEIHVLDLPPELSGRALRESRFLRDLSALATPDAGAGDPAPQVSISDQLVLAAIHEIHVGRAEAFFNPLVVFVTYELLKTAHYSANLQERRHALDRVGDVFAAFEPDLSQHVVRRAEQLVPRLQAYEALQAALDPLLGDLRRQGPSRALLAQFRRRVHPRVTQSDLKRWQQARSASMIALALVARQSRLSPKTLADQLALARKARDIEQAWGKYQAAFPPPAAVLQQPPSPPRPPSERP
jgi:hypothetical protein